uniref:Pre-mRNA cleavage complex 2 protein Pcf11 n=1 Tax=Cajanus cajan TaxID=3821 RepID=A0A151TVA4_CAJCA|nr:Pre-mRNA cleavage complex 2 protein Pcf11 [Cajanus cajan]
MESTRRSLDRSREPGPKKPRLIDELGARQLPQRQQGSGAVATLASVRFRTNDRDSESSDSGRGGGYQPQPPPHQELVAQYRTALDELTFNSKPIITNLTIIAGENQSAAKSIAATVCANILEVPSDQKLPSLYLLDSIVKNIGQDYIKYFAARLPEVFCKAYRQVDPSVHSSMKHLFGTWKGVFPPQCLQMIEKELGFAPAVNGSASVSATVRSDLQSQRPPHSIHVNPKYLERQRLQQSSRVGGVNDMTGAILNSNEDSERPDRALGASRPWLDPRINMQNNQHIHRDAFNDSVPEKNFGGSYGGSEYSSGISSNLVSVAGRTASRLVDLGHDKTWFKTGGDDAEIISGQRNGISLKRSFSNHDAPKSMNLDPHRQPRPNLMPGNWKNSEEEEFTWDEMNSGLIDHGPNVSSNLSRDSWMAEDENLVSLLKGKVKTTTKSLAILRNKYLVLGASFMPNAVVGMAKIAGQQSDSGETESPSGQSPLRQQSPSLPGTEKDMQGPLSSVTSFRPKLQQQKLDPSQTVTAKTKLPQSKISLARETSEQLTPINLPAAAIKSGINPKKSITSNLDPRNLPSQSGVQPTRAGRSSTTLISSGSAVASPSSLDPRHNDSSTLPKKPQVKAGQPPRRLSTQPPASSNVSSSSALSLNATNNLNPITNLLSSLVAKGLISAETESPNMVPSEVPMGSKDQTENITTSCSSPVTTVSGSVAVPVSSSRDEVDSASKTSLLLPQSTSTEIRNLIGFDFRPNVIRDFHPPVISELLDDFPHHCQVCGIRLKLEEQFNRHLEWHATREHGLTNASRSWYPKSSDWIAGKAEYSSDLEFTDSVDVHDQKTDSSQLDTMIVADENQCLCVLCGELFEDVYCQERNEWMFKGAVYMNYTDINSEMESINVGPIIHAKCLSENSIAANLVGPNI